MLYATICKSRKLLAALLLVVLTGYIACLSVSVHGHMVDGRVVYHSHPYSGNPDNPGHTHSSAQFIGIAQLSLLLMTAAAAAMAILVYRRVVAKLISADTYIRTTAALLTYGLRAPPAI